MNFKSMIAPDRELAATITAAPATRSAARVVLPKTPKQGRRIPTGLADVATGAVHVVTQNIKLPTFTGVRHTLGRAS